MRGEATDAQIAGFLVALRAKGETADEIAGCADAMRAHVLPVHPQRQRPRRHRRHRRRRRADAQHLDGGGARRGGRGRGRREARQPRRLLGLRLGGRARGARLRARAAAGADRAVDRRARLRLPVRAGPPPGDASRCVRATRARDANRLQRARSADEPGRRPRADRRRLLRPGSSGRSPRCSLQLGASARSSSTAPAGSTSCRRAARTRCARSWTGGCASGRSTRRSSGVERCEPDELRGGSPAENARGDPRRLRRRAEAGRATRSCSTPRARSPRPGTRTTSAKGSSSRGARSTRAPPPSASTTGRLLARRRRCAHDRSRRPRNRHRIGTDRAPVSPVSSSARAAGRRPALIGWGPKRPRPVRPWSPEGSA